MDFLENISEARVLVIGDVMLDRYLWGTVSRVSPEAPVPVVDLDKISSTAGGAANVAANVAGLGAKVLLIGIVGDDDDANSVLETLQKQNVPTEFLIKSKDRKTTIKTRIIAHNQQIVRVDSESKTELNYDEQTKVLENVDKLINEANVIIFSDYGKGFGTEEFLARLITTARKNNKLIFIDPKGKKYSRYSQATMLTPNRFELAEAFNLDKNTQANIETYGNRLLSELNLQYLLVTQGEDGMTLFEKEKESIHLPVEMRNVYDVTGAGDTVIACLAVAFGCGADFLEAAKFANKAAGIVIETVGTTAINLEMLKQND